VKSAVTGKKITANLCLLPASSLVFSQGFRAEAGAGALLGGGLRRTGFCFFYLSMYIFRFIKVFIFRQQRVEVFYRRRVIAPVKIPGF
jgi:hypothetical protein